MATADESIMYTIIYGIIIGHYAFWQFIDFFKYLMVDQQENISRITHNRISCIIACLE